MKLHDYFSPKVRSQDNERKVARIFKGRIQPASGALPIASKKGDVKSDQFLVEAKVTKHGSYALRLKTWNKINAEAWNNSRHPAMCIEFSDGTKLVVLSATTFQQMSLVHES
jgi:hypothetical protein